VHGSRLLPWPQLHQRQSHGLASLAASPAQAAANTARRQPEKDAISLIRQIKADAARCGRGGDLARAAGIGYGPAAEPELRPDAAARPPGDPQAGQQMLTQQAGTEEAAAAWLRLVPAGASAGNPDVSAWGPFWPWVMSNSTFCPSSRLRSPPPVIALTCTNTSGPPSTAMKP